MVFKQKSLLFFNIILSLLFILPLPVKAEWLKHSSNPVIPYSADGWDSLAVRSPAVIYDNSQFKLYYQGQKNSSNWQIGVAYSSNGVDWTKNTNNPIITPSSTSFIDENGLEEPAVLKDNLYRMWYKSDPTSTIRYATSTDGIVWDKYEKAVLTGTAYWENHGVANPSVIFKDGKYWMYYTAWGSDNGWLIGLATSPDGIIWTKYERNPLNLPLGDHLGRPSAIYYGGKFHLFYHTGYGRGTDIYHLVSDDGINFSCDGQCSILALGSPGSFDSNTIIGPSVIEHNSQIYLYYGGTIDNSHWQIGLASEQPIVLENKKTPIIILPGMFASWNKEAILHNQATNQEDWILNPVVHEYDGLIQTLTNLDYQNNKDFYVFTYDWRKSLNDSSTDLKQFLEAKFPSSQTKVNLIGHSLGGLIGRIYAQKYGASKINKLLTIGSPHQGVAQTYKPIEAGELEKNNTWLWLAEKIVLVLNKEHFNSDKQTINQMFPMIKDLFPTYNFLKNQNNQEISIQDMQIKNDSLLSYQSNFPDIFSYLKTIAGEKSDTLWGFKVGPRTIFDQLLDYYPDGRPQENFYQTGDYLVLSDSAKAGNNPQILNLDHGEIIYKKESIKKILDASNISYQDSQIIEGEKTIISPSLIFLILSPATIEVKFKNHLYPEQNGLIFIENAQSGNYTLRVLGKEKGQYTVFIGQIGINTDQWTKIEGEIIQAPPTSQIDSYIISFDSQNPSEFPVNQNDVLSLFDLLIRRLSLIRKDYNRPDFGEAIEEAQDAKANFLRRNYKKMRKQLLECNREIFSARKKAPTLYKNVLYDTLLQLENLYERSSKVSGYISKQKEIQKKISDLTKKYSSLEEYLIKQKQQGVNVLQKSISLSQMQEKLSKSKEAFTDSNFSLAEILLLSTMRLGQEIK